MEMERLEAEIKDLSRRVSKLETRAKGMASRSPRSRPTDHASHQQSSEGPAVQGQPDDWPGLETIEFRSVAAFERDLEGIDGQERQHIIDAINAKCPLWLKDRRNAEKEFLRPYLFRLRRGLESSLYEIPAGKARRVILAVDADPIFGQVIVTLLRVVTKDARKAAYEELAELLYPGQVLEVQTFEGEPR
jgi:chromosome segregation ATPase